MYNGVTLLHTPQNPIEFWFATIAWQWIVHPQVDVLLSTNVHLRGGFIKVYGGFTEVFGGFTEVCGGFTEVCGGFMKVYGDSTEVYDGFMKAYSGFCGIMMFLW